MEKEDDEKPKATKKKKTRKRMRKKIRKPRQTHDK